MSAMKDLAIQQGITYKPATKVVHGDRVLDASGHYMRVLVIDWTNEGIKLIGPGGITMHLGYSDTVAVREAE